MRFTTFSRLLAALAVMALLVPGFAVAQSTTQGAINGTVTDQSGAVLPDVNVALKNLEQGYTRSTKSNSQGAFQFPLLDPGTYALTMTAPNFKTLTVTTTVSVGQTSIVNQKLEVGAAGTTVEVSSEAPLLQSETSEISTTFNEREISEVPNPGNDLSFIAQTAPGSVMNTEGGYGNFSSFGISASSNLFTLNGMYDNDPFLNLNNSGATNLLLGQNEVAEATVVTNGYSGQYGGFAGANVNYITKSGSNNWHGNAVYWWNGRVMNAADYFSKNYQDPASVLPRQFDNANQYAASFGGPIWKNKAFFFWNYEGLRVLLPTSDQVYQPCSSSIPTCVATANIPEGGAEDFQTATINNLTENGLALSAPFYQSMFKFFNTAPGVGKAQALPAASSCGAYGSTESGSPYQLTDPTNGALFGQGGNPCTATYRINPTTFTHEYLTAGRFDFNITNNDKIFVRLQEDIGWQATYTDPINTLFNATSYQPEYQAQVSWNRAFGVKASNNLVLSAQYYRAIFGPVSLSNTLAAFPTTLLLGDGTMSTIGGDDFIWPQGRNVTGYQLVDDYSYALSAKHTLKLGLYFHRNLVSDHDYGFFQSGYDLPLDISSWFYGGNSPSAYALLEQAFPSSLDQPIKLYQLGWYLQDEWKPRSDLKLTLALRADHNSIPYCGTNCFAHFTGTFASIADPTGLTPYNTSIQTGLSEAMPSFTSVAWQPRFGFAYSPSWAKNTVFRGGIGLFMDTFPGQIADSLSGNSPLLNTFVTVLDNLSPTQTNSNLFIDAANSNSAFVAGFKAGENLPQIASNPVFTCPTCVPFTPPGFSNVSAVKAPIYQEWNFEVQHQIGNNTAVSLNYVGNHGTHETTFFNGINGYCLTSQCPNGWLGLPTAPADPRFGEVAQIQTAAISNYNGLSASFQHRFQHGLQLQVNYSWSHALDEISNGGFNGFGGGSLLSPISPFNLRAFNYGNADYDVRHYVSANYVYELPKGPTALLKGWQLSGTLFARSGFPFTVTNSAVTNLLSSQGFGGPATATYAGPSSYPHCGGPIGTLDDPVAGPGQTNAPCFPAADFPDSDPVAAAFGGTGPGPGNQLLTGLVNQRRNQLFGPHYFDTDMTIMKYTQIPHWETAKFGIGAQFFNLFNHPNFANPNNNINSPGFGTVTGTVNPPTSILGSFLGGDASVRLIQLTAKFNF